MFIGVNLWILRPQTSQKCSIANGVGAAPHFIQVVLDRINHICISVGSGSNGGQSSGIHVIVGTCVISNTRATSSEHHLTMSALYRIDRRKVASINSLPYYIWRDWAERHFGASKTNALFCYY